MNAEIAPGFFLNLEPPAPIRGDLEERILRNSALPEHGDCWIWLGHRQNRGYGRLSLRYPGRRNPVSLWAHRVAYEVFRGPIPVGMTVDHLCRCTSCVNPAHLELVSNPENARRAYHANRKAPRKW